MLKCIERDGWFSRGNQAMFFGPDLPDWLLDALAKIKLPLPDEVRHWPLVELERR